MLFQWDIGRDELVQGFRFAPVVEPDHDGAFLSQRMYDAVAAGGVSPVPLMIGIMSEEQLIRAEGSCQKMSTQNSIAHTM